jgi:hypothetical protein
VGAPRVAIGWFGVLFATGWLSVACGKNAADSAGAASPIPLAEVCHAFAEELCTRQACFRGFPCHIEECIANTDCPGKQDLESAVATGALIYNAARFGACHAAFLKDPCHANTGYPVLGMLDDCAGALTPTLGEGAACGLIDECLPGLYCNRSNACPGLCKRHETEGQPCHDYHACAANLDCGVNSICRRPPTKGLPCTGFDDCFCSSCKSSDLWCDLTTNTCQDRRNVGEACGADANVDRGPCQSTLWCDGLGAVGKCRAPSDAGGPCDFVGCKDGLHCVGQDAAHASLGQCSAVPSAVGGPCIFPPDCADGLDCVDSRCKPPLGLGEACVNTYECQASLVCASSQCRTPLCEAEVCGAASSACAFGACKDGKCTRRALANEPCAKDSDCASATCTGGTCVDVSFCLPP